MDALLRFKTRLLSGFESCVSLLETLVELKTLFQIEDTIVQFERLFSIKDASTFKVSRQKGFLFPTCPRPCIPDIEFLFLYERIWAERTDPLYPLPLQSRFIRSAKGILRKLFSISISIQSFFFFFICYPPCLSCNKWTY